MRPLLPKSLVGRNALFVTLILIVNQFLWFGFVRPAVFNRYVQAEQVHHPEGLLRLYVELEWGTFALLTSTVGAYVIFYWLRRQLQSVVRAARMLGSGQAPPRLPETGPEEIRELSHGFNQLAGNLETLEADRRLMLVGISHDLATPLTRLRLGLELMQIKGDLTQIPGMIRDVEDMNAILAQFKDYARSGKEEQLAAVDFNQIVADVCGRYIAAGNAIRSDFGQLPVITCRPLAMRRLVTNLVDNAARYGSRDFEVSTRVEGGKLVFAVVDRGPGIVSTDPNHFVKPFAREGLSRGTPLGAGLGLSIVDRIAKAHGGDLYLQNRDGGGLAVTVTLPCLRTAKPCAGTVPSSIRKPAPPEG
jgi:two-component system osmolarity sensor histidine kinase EnvZ